MSEKHIFLDDLAVSVLSDRDIKYELKEGDLIVDPISDEWLQIQPATIDLRLGNEFIILERENITHIDPLNEKDVEEYSKTIKVDDEFTLHPGRFVLGTTVERVEMPNYMIAEVEGRSSLGRLAIIVHATAGLVDPGYNGTITLELSNLGSAPVLLRPGMRICQLKMLYLNSIPDRPYGKERGSKYQNQDRPTPSKIGKDPEFQNDKQE